MAGNYDEQNNHTPYPLNGGARQSLAAELEEKYKQLKAENDQLHAELNNLKNILQVSEAKINFLMTQNKELQELLKLSICKGSFIQPVQPLQTTYGNGPRDVYGNPVPYCISKSEE